MARRAVIAYKLPLKARAILTALTLMGLCSDIDARPIAFPEGEESSDPETAEPGTMFRVSSWLMLPALPSCLSCLLLLPNTA